MFGGDFFMPSGRSAYPFTQFFTILMISVLILLLNLAVTSKPMIYVELS